MSVKMHVRSLLERDVLLYIIPDNLCSFCAETWHVKSTENGFVCFFIQIYHICGRTEYEFILRFFMKNIYTFCKRLYCIYVSKMYAQYIQGIIHIRIPINVITEGGVEGMGDGGP